MSDINDKKIQELKDILKALGFYENKKLLGYTKKIHNRLNLYISFVNPDTEVIDISCIDISSAIKIKGVYYLENGYKAESSQKMFLNTLYQDSRDLLICIEYFVNHLIKIMFINLYKVKG